MGSRLAGLGFRCVAALFVCLLAGCPDLDQLRAVDGENADGGHADARPFEGGQPEAGGDSGPTVTPVEGLIGKWDFEGTGNVAEDSSGNGHDCELALGATQESGAGIRGGGLVLHGLDNANIPSLAREAFPRTGTLALWLRYTEKSGDFGVFDVFDINREHFFLRRRPGDAGRLQAALQIVADPGAYAWEKLFPVNAETWVHLAFTWDGVGRTAALWVNGVTAEDNAFTSAFAFADQRVVLGDRLKGSIDELRIYNVVLSGDQIKQLATPP